MILKKLQIEITSVILFSILTGLIFFSSCEKEDTADFVDKAKVASQHLNADLEVNYFFSILHKAAYDTALINSDTSYIDSALVTRVFDTLSGKSIYTFTYPEGTISPNFKEKSGTFQAFLDMDFSNANATFEVLIYDFTINGQTLRGTLYYTNTGEMSGGAFKYKLESTIVFSGENQALITYNGDKEILWTEGFANPIEFPEQKFSLSGIATSNYVNAYNKNIPLADINAETDGVWDISFACPKLVKQGKILIEETISDITETISGDFLDTDIDGCSDKVMLKNSKNFGYPFYF